MSNLPCANLCTGCVTSTATPIQPYLTVYCPDSYNSTNNIVDLACTGNCVSGYYNGSRIILDGSYNTNGPNGSYSSVIQFQSQSSGTTWQTNAEFKTALVSSLIVSTFYFMVVFFIMVCHLYYLMKT